MSNESSNEKPLPAESAESLDRRSISANSWEVVRGSYHSRDRRRDLVGVLAGGACRRVDKPKGRFRGGGWINGGGWVNRVGGWINGGGGGGGWINRRGGGGGWINRHGGGGGWINRW